MKQIGVITVARWMSETLPDDMVAYMVSDRKLYQLLGIRSCNGILEPQLSALFRLHATSVFIPVKDSYSLESPVFLTSGRSLAGVAFEDIADQVEECQVGCWALRDKPACAVTRVGRTKAQEAWETPWKCATSIPAESWHG